MKLDASFERNGQGRLSINDIDISKISSGLLFQNDCRKGNSATITLPSPALNLKTELDEIFFIIDGKKFVLVEIKED